MPTTTDPHVVITVQRGAFNIIRPTEKSAIYTLTLYVDGKQAERVCFECDAEVDPVLKIGDAPHDVLDEIMATDQGRRWRHYISSDPAERGSVAERVGCFRAAIKEHDAAVYRHWATGRLADIARGIADLQKKIAQMEAEASSIRLELAD